MFFKHTESEIKPGMFSCAVLLIAHCIFVFYHISAWQTLLFLALILHEPVLVNLVHLIPSYAST